MILLNSFAAAIAAGAKSIPITLHFNSEAINKASYPYCISLKISFLKHRVNSGN